jgi:lipid-binding SYLF domain-containing protein
MRCCSFVMAAIALTALLPARASARQEERTVESSISVLNEFLDLQIKSIPESMLAESHGVAIIPNLVKVGLVVGGQRGHGVVIIREKDGGWRAPTFITMTGGSVGWQIGAQSTDIVLVFKTQKSVQGLLKGKFTIGADAAAAAGPVGRRAGAATDAELRAEIYSYSRSRGLFAGISLDGSVLQVDGESNAAYYGQPGTPVPEPALKLVGMIAQLATAAPTEAARPIDADRPIEATPALPLVTPQPPPDNQAESLRVELARSATVMTGVLDENWRSYLALPVEIYRGGQPSPDSVRSALMRYDAIASDPQYRALARRPEFQATHDLLNAYHGSLAGQAGPTLALPPPPRGR